MNRRHFLAASAASSVLALSSGLRRARAGEAPAAGADDLAGHPKGPWRRLFLDASVTEESAGLNRVFHQAEKHAANPLIVADHEWEGSNAIRGPYVYGTVLREDGRLRMWYQVLNKGNHVGYAESRDGIAWTKPELGLISINGSRANNLVVSAFDESTTGAGQCHNPSVVRRPGETDPARRYALYGYDGKAGHARVAFSPDGLRWRFDPATATQPAIAVCAPTRQLWPIWIWLSSLTPSPISVSSSAPSRRMAAPSSRPENGVAVRSSARPSTKAW